MGEGREFKPHCRSHPPVFCRPLDANHDVGRIGTAGPAIFPSRENAAPPNQAGLAFQGSGSSFSSESAANHRLLRVRRLSKAIRVNDALAAIEAIRGYTRLLPSSGRKGSTPGSANSPTDWEKRES
jgi:hypothetical protein